MKLNEAMENQYNASGYAGAVLYAMPVVVIYAIFAVYLRTQSALKHTKEAVRL